MEGKVNVFSSLQALGPLSIPGDLVPIPRAAAIAGLSPITLRTYIRQGRLSRYGRAPNYRVSLSELLPANQQFAPSTIRAPT